MHGRRSKTIWAASLCVAAAAAVAWLWLKPAGVPPGAPAEAQRPRAGVSGQVVATRPKPGEGGPQGVSPRPALVRELDEILESRDDNDPRLDHDFSHLTGEEKAAFRARYRELPAEKRNSRGTIVFLLARNLASAEDLAFLKEVVSEPPCLSIADCSKAPAGVDAHFAAENAVTLVYPQLVALKLLGDWLAAAGPDAPPAASKDAALEVVRAAARSHSSLVAGKAASLEGRFSHGQ